MAVWRIRIRRRRSRNWISSPPVRTGQSTTCRGGRRYRFCLQSLRNGRRTLRCPSPRSGAAAVAAASRRRRSPGRPASPESPSRRLTSRKRRRSVSPWPKFDATRFDPARHHRLVLTIKHDQPGALDLSIPERNWNGTLRYQLELDDRTGEFRRYRIDLLPQLTSLLKGKALRGELFLYNGEDKHAFFPRPAVTVELKEVWFE